MCCKVVKNWASAAVSRLPFPPYWINISDGAKNDEATSSPELMGRECIDRIDMGKGDGEQEGAKG